jgi:hypothetical protein
MNTRCALRSGHSGHCLWTRTTHPTPILGECLLRPETKPHRIKLPSPQPPPPPLTDEDKVWLDAIDEGWGR